jgi:asparagine synthase (glutamine-hydrolysing)
MCGIAGRFNFRTGAPVEAAVVAEMCALLAHRGPDGQGVHVDGCVGLGHRRLAIIDLSEAGAQPMSTDDGRCWVTFNGEIYNFLELRERFERRGYRFRSHTDTEVILAAYQEMGVGCLELFRGMFAFALWDAAKQTLLLARDRLGKKPLFYRVDRDGLAFASEPKAFLAEAGFESRADLRALSHFLAYQYVPSPMSAFDGVSKLSPAHYALVSAAGVATTRYWTLEYRPKLEVSEDEAAERVRAELREATRLRMISDVPLGAFLSGGIDSSAVVALMATMSGQPVKTFSIGFTEQGFDELEYARLVSRRYGTEHHEFVVRPDATEVYDALVWHYNEPFADPSAIPTYHLAKLTRQRVTVALNGDAGDENFAGYGRYAPRGAGGWYEDAPRPVRSLAAALLGPVPAEPGGAGVWARLKRKVETGALDPNARYAVRMMQFKPWLMRELCTEEFWRSAGVDRALGFLASSMAEAGSLDPLDARLEVDVRTYLPDALLVKVDIASMAHGLESRSPLLDHRLMEFAARLPVSFKRRGSTSKYILKKAVRDLVPKAIVERPKKGFSVPLEHWFRHELRELAYDVLLDARARARGYFRPAAVRRLLDEHVAAVRRWDEQLWNLLMLELWHRMFVDRRRQPAAAAPVVVAARDR